MSSVKLRHVALMFLGCTFGGGTGGVELECNESQWEREGEGIPPTGKRVDDKKNGEDPPSPPRGNVRAKHREHSEASTGTRISQGRNWYHQVKAHSSLTTQ